MKRQLHVDRYGSALSECGTTVKELRLPAFNNVPGNRHRIQLIRFKNAISIRWLTSMISGLKRTWFQQLAKASLVESRVHVANILSSLLSLFLILNNFDRA